MSFQEIPSQHKSLSDEWCVRFGGSLFPADHTMVIKRRCQQQQQRTVITNNRPPPKINK